MSEDKSEKNSETEDISDENRGREGGFFDQLIEDFSLGEPPAVKETRQDENGEVIVETVDGIVLDAGIYESDIPDTDSYVIYDEAAENDKEVREAGEHFKEPEKSGGIIAYLFPVKGDSAGEVIRKIVFLIAVIVFITAAVLLVINLTESKRAIEDKQADETLIVTTLATSINEDGEVVTVMPTEEEVLRHNFSVMEYYKNINSDVVGFMELAGCDIALPVVQTTDNDYYLTHTYYKGKNQAGSIFMDYRCTFTENYVSPNIVLYGHNQRDGTMFGNLKKYKYDLNFYEENPIITLSSGFETKKYVIFGYFVTNTLERQDSNREVFHYHDYIETLANPGTFGWYMNEIKERNQIISPVDVTYGDRLLVLSTCSNEYSESRFVVFARMLRANETEDTFDFSETELNRNAKGIDWNAILSVPTRAKVPQRVTTAAASEETTTSSEESITTEETGSNILPSNIDELLSMFTTTVTESETSRRTRRTTAEETETVSETSRKKKKTETEVPAETEAEETSRKKKTTAEDSEPAAETEPETKKTKKKTQTETETEETSKTRKKTETEERTEEVTTAPPETTVQTKTETAAAPAESEESPDD